MPIRTHSPTQSHVTVVKAIQESGNYLQSRRMGALLTINELQNFYDKVAREVEDTEFFKKNGCAWFYLDAQGARPLIAYIGNMPGGSGRIIVRDNGADKAAPVTVVKRTMTSNEAKISRSIKSWHELKRNGA
ncbi:MAG: hypothetical protein KGH64_00310 [Candidatus Micrarchaeota archaeon]|nr:hypothetical protein [Candidatus Micrarchaeota archaeon]MDE1833758.1 hypothetical protein [Candidatus Micrarchaeota archaeon]MDE1860066.1 hypothetical protein [Candidatus Micrarchaeota archaeon]